MSFITKDGCNNASKEYLDKLRMSLYPLRLVKDIIATRISSKHELVLDQCITAVENDATNSLNSYHSVLHHAEVMFIAARLYIVFTRPSLYHRFSRFNSQHFGLMMIAAAIHDYRYGAEDTEHYDSKEIASVEEAKKHKLLLGLTPEEIRIVAYLILATTPSYRPYLRGDMHRKSSNDLPVKDQEVVRTILRLGMADVVYCLSDADMSFSSYLGLDEHCRTGELLEKEGFTISTEQVYSFLTDIAGPPIIPIKDGFADALEEYSAILKSVENKLRIPNNIVVKSTTTIDGTIGSARRVYGQYRRKYQS